MFAVLETAWTSGLLWEQHSQRAIVSTTNILTQKQWGSTENFSVDIHDITCILGSEDW